MLLNSILKTVNILIVWITWQKYKFLQKVFSMEWCKSIWMPNCIKYIKSFNRKQSNSSAISLNMKKLISCKEFVKNRCKFEHNSKPMPYQEPANSSSVLKTRNTRNLLKKNWWMFSKVIDDRTVRVMCKKVIKEFKDEEKV